MGELEDFVGFEIKPDHIKKTCKIYQPDPINNMTQGFN